MLLPHCKIDGDFDSILDSFLEYLIVTLFSPKPVSCQRNQRHNRRSG